MIDWIKSLFKREPRPETISIGNFIVSLECEIRQLHELIDIQLQRLDYLDRSNKVVIPHENPFVPVMEYAARRIDILGVIDAFNEQIRFNQNLIQLIKK